MATLIFDGPGQGEGQYDFAIRGDYEAPVKAVIDFIETRRDLDAARVAMWGVSLGGYYAPRAAAFDKRIKACIALGGPFDFGAAWDGLPELTREAFRVRSHAKSDAEARKNAATLTLVGIAQNITCPIYIVNGRHDRIVPAADAERLAREVKGPVELVMIEDGNHIANNRAYRWRSQSADWLKEQLLLSCPRRRASSTPQRGGSIARKAFTGSPPTRGRRPTQAFAICIVEVVPIRIRFFNQSNLPGPIPFLHLLFARDRRFHIGMNFIINKLGNTVSLGEAFYEPFAMLINPTN